MRIKQPILALVFILLVSIGSAVASAQEHLAIGVLDFTVLDRSFSVNPSVLTDSLTTMIHKLGRFEVIERSRLSAILENAGLSMSGVAEVSDRTSLGRIKGVDLLVIASIGKLGTDIVVNARFIRLPTGEVAAAEQVRGQSERDLEAMLQQLVGKVQKMLALDANIV